MPLQRREEGAWCLISAAPEPPNEQHRFERDRRGAALEVIEVKEALNRPVVGQLIVARDIIRRQWPEVAKIHLVAVVARDDTLIHELCREVYDIAVAVISQRGANPSP